LGSGQKGGKVSKSNEKDPNKKMLYLKLTLDKTG
jgi:hypothetical protein